MNKRLKKLHLALKALDIKPTRPRSKAVQASIFLAQVRGCGIFDPIDQTGYFFKWHGGPYSSRLSENYDELVMQLWFENATGYSDMSSTPLASRAKSVYNIVDPKGGISFANWTEGVAAVAYLVGVGWKDEDVVRECKDVLDVFLDVDAHYENLKYQAQKIIKPTSWKVFEVDVNC